MFYSRSRALGGIGRRTATLLAGLCQKGCRLRERARLSDPLAAAGATEWKIGVVSGLRKRKVGFLCLCIFSVHIVSILG